MQHIAAHVHESGNAALAALYERKAAEARERAESVRRAVMGHETVGEDRLGEQPRDHA